MITTPATEPAITPMISSEVFLAESAENAKETKQIFKLPPFVEKGIPFYKKSCLFTCQTFENKTDKSMIILTTCF